MKYRTFTFTDDIYSWLSPKPKGVEVDTALIKTILESNKPCMISRFGSTELQTLLYCKFYPLSLSLKKRIFYNIQYASGFFPVTFENLKKFYRLYADDVKDLDLLVSWRIEELFFQNWISKLPEIKKTTLDSFYAHEHPWTILLLRLSRASTAISVSFCSRIRKCCRSLHRCRPLRQYSLLLVIQLFLTLGSMPSIG